MHLSIDIGREKTILSMKNPNFEPVTKKAKAAAS